ncbi:MAG: Gfo/Idh/MocA family protein [Planctomycetota bacterium]
MTAEDRAKIGFVGVGSMGQCAHLKHYASLPDCEVPALAEIREDVAAKVAARYGVPRVYPDHRQLLEKEKLDGIVCVQPFTRHGILLPDVLAPGVPVLIEKPLASSVKVGERIVEAAAASGATLMVGYNKRSDLATVLAKAEIERLKSTGELGSMRYVRITIPPGDWIQGGFDDLIGGEYLENLEEDPAPADMGAAASKHYKSFVNYYIHQVNLLRHLLGEPYRVTYSEKSRALFVAESESGVACVIEMSPYSTTLDWQESALVGFEHGYVKLDLPAPLAANRAGRVEILRDPGSGKTPETVVPDFPSTSAMRRQAINFIKVVKGEAEPPCGAEEALEDLKVARSYMRLLESAS